MPKAWRICPHCAIPHRRLRMLCTMCATLREIEDALAFKAWRKRRGAIGGS